MREHSGLFSQRRFAFLHSSFWQAPCGWQTTSGCFQQLLAQISLAVSPDCSDRIGRVKRQGPRGGAGLQGQDSVESVNGGFYGDQRSVMWPCTLIRDGLRRWSHLSERSEPYAPFSKRWKACVWFIIKPHRWLILCRSSLPACKLMHACMCASEWARWIDKVCVWW